MKKSFHSLFLCLFFLASIGAQAETASGKCGKNVTWTYDTGTTILTISGIGAMKSYSATGASQGWYINTDDEYTDYNKYISKIVVEEGVTSIGGYAFYTDTLNYKNGGYPNLKEVVLPSSLDSIHGGAFARCNAIETITFGTNLHFIGNSSFWGCESLDNVSLPNSLLTIGEAAFRNCTSLTAIDLGDSITTISNGAFYNCSSLKNISIPASLVTIGNLAFYKTAITSLDLSKATNLSGEIEINTDNNNTMYILPAGKDVKNTKNVIINGTCANFELTDGYDFAPSQTFNATSASYSRTMGTQWGTICLPYTVTSNSNVAYYKIARIQNSTLILEKYETLPAGTPAIVKKLSGSAIEPTATSVSVCTSAGSLSGTVNMYGSFTNNTRVEAENAYYLMGDTFKKCNGYFFIDAFRAYFTVDSNAKVFDICEEETTGIESLGSLSSNSSPEGKENMYNLQGVRVNEDYRGIVIINGKKFLNK